MQFREKSFDFHLRAAAAELNFGRGWAVERSTSGRGWEPHPFPCSGSGIGYSLKHAKRG